MKARLVGRAQSDYNMRLACARILSFAVIELHEEFGFGRGRLMQFIIGVNNQSKQFREYQDDDVGDEMLCKSLFRIKLDEWAEEIIDLKK